MNQGQRVDQRMANNKLLKGSELKEKANETPFAESE